jgi:hypothetical protein
MREENPPMPFSVKAYIDDHTLTADADTAKDAFAIAVEWHVAERLTGISISDGIKKYSIAEFSSVLADLLQLGVSPATPCAGSSIWKTSQD